MLEPAIAALLRRPADGPVGPRNAAFADEIERRVALNPWILDALRRAGPRDASVASGRAAPAPCLSLRVSLALIAGGSASLWIAIYGLARLLLG